MPYALSERCSTFRPRRNFENFFESFDGRKRDNESGARGLHPHIRVPWSPHDVYDLGLTRGDLVELSSCTCANPSPNCPQTPRVCLEAILTEKETT